MDTIGAEPHALDTSTVMATRRVRVEAFLPEAWGMPGVPGTLGVRDGSAMTIVNRFAV